MSRAARAFVALGSNLGNREAQLAAAVSALRASRGVGQVECSPIYETEPVGGPPQRPFLNQVVRLVTTLSPRRLLDRLLAIEAALGRRRGPERNAPRTLDLDLLLYGVEIVEEEGLEVPHPRLHERAFVLVPLADLAPELRHPRSGERISTLLARLPEPAGVRRWAAPARATRRT